MCKNCSGSITLFADGRTVSQIAHTCRPSLPNTTRPKPTEKPAQSSRFHRNNFVEESPQKGSDTAPDSLPLLKPKENRLAKVLPLLDVNGFDYCFHSVSNGKYKLYLCQKRKSQKCFGNVIVMADGTIVKQAPHTCRKFILENKEEGELSGTESESNFPIKMNVKKPSHLPK